MRLSLILSLATLSALTAALPAGAQTVTPPTDGQAMSPPNDGKGFSGLYVGGSFGGAFLGTRQREIRFDRNLDGNFGDTVTTGAGANAFSPGFCPGSTTSPVAAACTYDHQGFEYYGRAGVDVQRGRFVAGIVGEFGRPEVRETVTGFSTTPANYVMSRDVRWNINGRLRAGYTPNDTTLFYVAGGPSYARIRTRIASSNTANSFTTNGSQQEWGYNVGGGLEQRIARNLSIGVEYLYTDITADKGRVRVGPGTAPATNPFLLGNAAGTDFRFGKDQMAWHSMRVTAAFRF